MLGAFFFLFVKFVRFCLMLFCCYLFEVISCLFYFIWRVFFVWRHFMSDFGAKLGFELQFLALGLNTLAGDEYKLVPSFSFFISFCYLVGFCFFFCLSFFQARISLDLVPIL